MKPNKYTKQSCLTVNTNKQTKRPEVNELMDQRVADIKLKNTIKQA